MLQNRFTGLYLLWHLLVALQIIHTVGPRFGPYKNLIWTDVPGQEGHARANTSSRLTVRSAYFEVHGLGVQPAASGSFLKSEVVM